MSTAPNATTEDAGNDGPKNEGPADGAPNGVQGYLEYEVAEVAGMSVTGLYVGIAGIAFLVLCCASCCLIYCCCCKSGKEEYEDEFLDSEWEMTKA